MEMRNRERRVPYLFHLPTIVVLSAITLLPLLYTLSLSFHGYRLSSPGSEHRWAGLENYASAFRDENFWNSFAVTLKFALGATVAQTVVGMGLALVLNSIVRARKLLFSLILVPMTVAPLIVGLMYSFTVNPDVGIYTFLVEALRLPLPQDLRATGNSALLLITITDIWEWTPYMALIFLAGLQSIDFECYEASWLDGANSWQVFRKVTLPLMRPVIIVALLLRVVEAFKEFDKPYILTGGGPGAATEVVDMFTYRETFVKFNFSYGAAICVVLFALLLVLGVAYGKLVMEGKNEWR